MLAVLSFQHVAYGSASVTVMYPLPDPLSGLVSAMPYPLVVPHSGGADVIDVVGLVSTKPGSASWCGCMTRSPTRLMAPRSRGRPSTQPKTVSAELGATLGIPGITAHRAVFADGLVTGQTVLVHGVHGAVSSLVH